MLYTLVQLTRINIVKVIGKYRVVNKYYRISIVIT